MEDISKLFSPSEYGPVPINHALPVFTIQQVTEAEVANIIGSLNNSKAKDIYSLGNMFLKAHKDFLVGPITHRVNLSIRHSVVPSSWKVAIVNPIFKSGSRTDMNNYRPINILPITSKIIEKCVLTQLTEHLNRGHTPLHPAEFGFQEHHSTGSAINLF